MNVYQFDRATLEKTEFPISGIKAAYEHRYCKDCGEKMLELIEPNGKYSEITGNEMGDVFMVCPKCGVKIEIAKVYLYDGDWWLSNFRNVEEGAEEYYRKYQRNNGKR